MFPRIPIFKAGAICALLALAACASGGNAGPPPATPGGTLQTLANGVPGGGGGGGGGGTTTGFGIPNPTVDGPAAWLENGSGVIGSVVTAANNLVVDYGRFQNLQPGGIAQGATRTGQLGVFNVSKKTALTFSAIDIGGANPGDFTISAADLSRILATNLPPNKSAGVFFGVTFSPTAEGTRTATVSVTTNAGVLNFLLTGTGLANRPIITGFGTGPGAGASLSFCTSPNCAAGQLTAQANMQISNAGGVGLQIISLQFIGANPTAFTNQFPTPVVGNCHQGDLLGPLAFCNLSVGPSGLVPGPASATLQILTNDPVTPEVDIQLTLTP